MTMLTNIFMCVLGIMFMFSAFFAAGIRPALSRRGPSQPISTAGRIIFFLAGAAVFVSGFNQLFSGFRSSRPLWLRALPFIAAAMIAMLLNARRVRAYFVRVATGKPDIAVRFHGGFPSALVTLRIAFFVIVAVMLVFGFAPIPFSTAKVGIIACVLAVFALGLLYQIVESHYVNTGRASVIKLTDNNAQK